MPLTRPSPDEQAQWARVMDVLERALDLPLLQRGRVLDELCGVDATLRAEVEALLAADDEAELHFRLPSEDESPRVGARVGAWRLVGELGEGGMGRVFLAERADGQYEQRAAVKVLKGGLWAEGRARFLRERQIVASLDHPSIARALDGGVERGFPWLALEYVEGSPITEWCAARAATVEHRVRLFVEVCRAVQHAHQNLVVHRDLKPSNIFVDASGRVRLLDFGIARLLDDSSARSSATRVMTPEYASPEQVRGLPVTTATDVHGLGVVLYELLTGRRAFAAGSITLEQAVVSTEPSPPSEVAPKPLRHALKGDLDRIVLEALEKDPSRRYQTAEALGDELERFLDGRPVLARRGSMGYRVIRFVRRNRVLVGAALAVTIALAVGVAGTLYQARQARIEAARARAVADFLLSLFRASDPAQAKGEPLSARALLDRGAARALNELGDQPETQEVLLEEIGDVYLQLGAYPEAERMARAVLERRQRAGAPPASLARALTALGDVLYDEGRYAEAETNYLEAFSLTRDLTGEASRPAIDALWGLGGTRAQLGDLATAERHRLEVASRWKALDGPRSSTYAQAANSLGVHYLRLGLPSTARPWLETALELRRGFDGLENPSTLLIMYNLAGAHADAEEWGDAKRLLDELTPLELKLLGPNHPNVLLAHRLEARVLTARAAFDEAEALFSSVLERQRLALGDGPVTAFTQLFWAETKRARGDGAGAERTLREALDVLARTQPATHPDLARLRTELAQVLVDRQAWDDADALLTLADATPRNDPHGARTIEVRGNLEHARHHPDEARAFWARALALLEERGASETPAARRLRARLDRP